MLDTEGERGDIDEDDIGGALGASQNITPDSGAVRDALIGVDVIRGFFTEVLLEELLDLGDTV
jgi:hypothetical protein